MTATAAPHRRHAAFTALPAPSFSSQPPRDARLRSNPLGAPTFCSASPTLWARCFLALLARAEAGSAGGDSGSCLVPAPDLPSSGRRLIGYSCRALFQCLLETLLKLKPDLVVGITPMQHTSFRNIVEGLVPAENVCVLRVEETLHAVLPPQRRCDVLVVTHVFGQDLDISAVHRGVSSEDGARPLVVEDRCQGGTLQRRFSHEYVDIAIHSMGMDKRPCALGGGFMDIRNGSIPFAGTPLLVPVSARIDGLPPERVGERLYALLKMLPLWLMYNFHTLQVVVYAQVDVLTFLGWADGITGFAKAVRKANPGFEHHKYMKRPSAALRSMILAQLGQWRSIEDRITARQAIFLAALGTEAACEYMPWLHRSEATGVAQPCVSVYNSVVVDAGRLDAFTRFAKRRGLICVPNPTYVVCQSSLVDSAAAGVVKRLFYLSCLSGLSDAGIRTLAAHLLDFRRCGADGADEPPHPAPQLSLPSAALRLFRATTLVSALAFPVLLYMYHLHSMPSFEAGTKQRIGYAACGVPCCLALGALRYLVFVAVRRLGAVSALRDAPRAAVTAAAAPAVDGVAEVPAVDGVAEVPAVANVGSSEVAAEEKVEKLAACVFKLGYYLSVVLAFFVLPAFGWRYGLSDGRPPPTPGEEMVGAQGQSLICALCGNAEVGVLAHLYVALSLGYVLHNIVFVLCFAPIRTDYWEMLAHHLCTVNLLLFAYLDGRLRVVTAVLFLHDVPDVLGYLTKISVEVAGMGATLASYSGLMVAWAYFRLWQLPREVLVPCLAQFRLEPNWKSVEPLYYYSFVLLYALICVLFLLNVYWYALFIRMGYAAATGKGAKDIQEQSIEANAYGRRRAAPGSLAAKPKHHARED